MPSRRLLALATVAALAVGTVACSSDAHSDGTATTAGGTATTAAASTAVTPAEPTRPDGPEAKVDKELTAGSIFLAAARPVDLAAAGYEEHEYQVSGTAVAYDGAQPADGNWDLAPTGATGDYVTRIVVRRPKDPAKANGTVLVEWLNVSGGLDANPDFAYLAPEILRSGDTWVGVSAQAIGIEGGPTAVGLPGLDAITGKGLRAMDPARYGELTHPGDRFAYDLFTQVGRAVRADAEGIVGGTPKHVLAIGESQSGFALTTYADGIQPLTKAFDGFFIHSRGGSPLPLTPPGGGKSADIAGALAGPPTKIREDLGVPVFMLESESDVVGLLNYLPARQDDTDDIVTWEMAGTAHVDLYMLGAIAETAGCKPAVNNGPHTLIARAALRSLRAWVADGTAPVRGARLEVQGDAYVRDDLGIVKGGVRTPPVDVPVDVLSGDAAPDASVFCLLAGTTTPIPAATLAERYPTRADYQREYDASADEAIEAGFVLTEDRQELLDMAQPDRITA